MFLKFAQKVPSNVEFRRILMHMPVHGKALFLTLAKMKERKLAGFMKWLFPSFQL